MSGIESVFQIFLTFNRHSKCKKKILEEQFFNGQLIADFENEIFQPKKKNQTSCEGC